MSEQTLKLYSENPLSRCGEWGDREFSESKASAENSSIGKFSSKSYGSGYRAGFDEGKRQGRNNNQELIHELREQIERSESKFIGEELTDSDFKRRVEKAMDEIFAERQYIPLQRYGQ